MYSIIKQQDLEKILINLKFLQQLIIYMFFFFDLLLIELGEEVKGGRYMYIEEGDLKWGYVPK